MNRRIQNPEALGHEPLSTGAVRFYGAFNIIEQTRFFP